MPITTEQVIDIALAQVDGTLSAQTLHDTSGFPALKDIGQPNIIAASYDGENSYRFNAREMPNTKKVVHKSRERTPFLLKDGLEIELGGARVHVRGDVDEVTLQAVFDALRPG